MNRVVYGKEGAYAWVMDVRDIYRGMYSVERCGAGGYVSVFSSRNLNKCIDKAKQITQEMQDAE